MLPQAVIFDMDGLMLDTEWIYGVAWERAAGELGFVLEYDLLISCVGRTIADGEASLLQAYGDRFPLEEFRVRWPQVWEEIVDESGIQCKPGLLELLDLLDSLAIPKAVATSSAWDEALFSLSRGAIAHRFVHIVTADQVPHGKPAPDLFLLAAQRLGVNPSACLAFEDSEAGVIAATTAGMKTYMVPDCKQPSPQVAALASAVFTSLTEALPLFVDASGETP
ncbi:MAG: HAD family phosphatase [Caldilineaceae bacterium]|nr:HAD family phosphatase [Caldilineaceae bacterium]